MPGVFACVCACLTYLIGGLEHVYFFPYILIIIIPIDFHIFQRGRVQPPTRYIDSPSSIIINHRLTIGFDPWHMSCWQCPSSCARPLFENSFVCIRPAQLKMVAGPQGILGRSWTLTTGNTSYVW